MTPALRALGTIADALAGQASAEQDVTAAPAPSVRAVTGADTGLVRRCVDGDEAAQRAFVERYTALVFSVCRRRGLAPDAAEDVTQEVLIQAFRALPRFRGDARLSTWLFTLASRHVAHYLRSPARRQVALGHPGDQGFPLPQAADEASLEARVLARDRSAKARAAVDALAEPARTILLAYYLGEMSVAQIAGELDLPAGTVKSHLHRGRRAVRERLEAL